MRRLTMLWLVVTLMSYTDYAISGEIDTAVEPAEDYRVPDEQLIEHDGQTMHCFTTPQYGVLLKMEAALLWYRFDGYPLVKLQLSLALQEIDVMQARLEVAQQIIEWTEKDRAWIYGEHHKLLRTQRHEEIRQKILGMIPWVLIVAENALLVALIVR